jgi:hypothetical protein
MAGVGFWPVAVLPVGKVAAATVLWGHKGRLHVTVVVKARFRFEPDGVMTSMMPEPVRPLDGELAPYLGQTDVVLTAGSACACPPRATEAVAVRLAVCGIWPLVDKQLLVVAAAPGGARAPFERLALVGRGSPVLAVNPRRAGALDGLAALGPDAPERRALLGDAPAPVARAGVLEVADQFPWSYLQVAPADQRCAYLRGDEWVVLDGMHPTLARVQSRLPGAVAEVMVHPPGFVTTPGPPYAVVMQLDRLSVDADALTCGVVWRGSFPVADESSARALTLVAALSLPGQPAKWPDVTELGRSPLLRARGLVPPDASSDPELVLSTADLELVAESDELFDVGESARTLAIDELEAEIASARARASWVRETVQAASTRAPGPPPATRRGTGPGWAEEPLCQTLAVDAEPETSAVPTAMVPIQMAPPEGLRLPGGVEAERAPPARPAPAERSPLALTLHEGAGPAWEPPAPPPRAVAATLDLDAEGVLSVRFRSAAEVGAPPPSEQDTETRARPLLEAPGPGLDSETAPKLLRPVAIAGAPWSGVPATPTTAVLELSSSPVPALPPSSVEALEEKLTETLQGGTLDVEALARRKID